MHLIEILLPLYDNNKKAFKSSAFDEIRNELTEIFGGVTAFLRSPAEGRWQESDGEVSRDEIVIFEVMSERLEPQMVAQYRLKLEHKFQQEQLIIRVSEVEQL
ncbi:MAG: hypothetical protein ACR2G5_01905 [Pyrinomonadaceae bacterium]